MSSLKIAERQVLEQHFGMASGYVLNFSDRTFGEFVQEAVGRKIHEAKYTAGGTSKANKLRTFWKLETDQMVGRLILALVDYDAMLNPTQDVSAKARAERCRQITTRLVAVGPLPSAELQPLAKRETLVGLRDRFLQISTLPPHDRGYAFEKFLYDLFDA